MSDDVAVPDLPPRRIRQEGTCVRCGKLVWRDSPGQRWTDQYGRNRCRASWDDDQCDVQAFTEQEQEPRMVPALAMVCLMYRDENGNVQVMESPAVPEGTAMEATLPEPLTVIGWRIETKPPKLVS
jgi:hypothetical protein